MNAPERGEYVPMRVTVHHDTKIPNAATFNVEGEDHTLGNMLRMKSLKNTDVLFSGYKVPHPLENRFLLRIQTSKDTHPTAAVHRSAQDLIEELSLFEQKFKDEVERRRERIPESSYR